MYDIMTELPLQQHVFMIHEKFDFAVLALLFGGGQRWCNVTHSTTAIVHHQRIHERIHGTARIKPYENKRALQEQYCF